MTQYTVAMGRHTSRLPNARAPGGRAAGSPSVPLTTQSPLEALGVLRLPAPQLADLLPEIIWTADAAGRSMSASVRSGPFEVVRRPDGTWDWERSVHPDDLPEARAAWAVAVESRRPFEREVRLKAREGAYRWQLTRALPVPKASGSVQWVGTCTDIHDLRMTHQALEESEERLRLLADNAYDAIWTMSPDGRITYVSPAVERMRGFTPAEAMRQSLAEIHPPDSAAITLQYFQKLHATVAAGLPVDRFHAELEYYCKDGSTMWAELQVIPRLGPAGELLEILGVSRDITARRDAQQALEASEEELRAANEGKNLFIGTLSHELRNPLAAIRMALDVLQVTPGDQEALGVVDRATSQMTRLVDDLLDVTRIVQRKIQLHVSRLDFCPLVRQVVSDSARMFARAGVTLESHLTAGPCWVDADAQRIRQVIENVLRNAATYTAAGDRVTVVLGREGTAAVVRVKDTGRGIEPELLPHLFEPFVQSRQGLDREFGGLGLGLPIARQIVELHGGSMGAQRAGPGMGAEFVMRFPLVPATAPPPVFVSAEAAPARRVLLVEDDAILRAITVTVLRQLGQETAAAASAAEALGIARTFHPEVILSDIGLPGMTGFELAAAIRGDRELQDVHLIALTGYAQPRDIEQCRAAGFDQHLAKPIDRAQLSRALGRAARPASEQE